MTMTLDSVPAKLNELDLRAPLEVFEAIEAAIHERADLWSKWQAERCFRAKAEAELAAFKARMFQGIVLDVDDLARGHAGLPSEWRGKRVLLVVEE